MPPRRTFLLRHVKNEPPSEAALERYLLHWRTGDLYNTPDLFPRLTSEALFGNDHPLSLEIGCGTGEFLCDLAARHPEHNFIGLDINMKSLYVAIHEAVERGLDNVRLIKSAIQFLYQLMPDGSLHTVYSHFPEPILRPKFRKRRVFNDEFFIQMARALVPGGILSIVTDSEELLHILLPLIESYSELSRTHDEPYLLGYEPPVKSRYQQYWEAHDVLIYRIELRRVVSG